MQSRAFCLAFILAGSTALITACDSSVQIGSPPPPPGDPGADPFEVRLDKLNEELHPMTSIAPDGPQSDLEPLERIAQARVIGMGEATHGTREFFHLKHRIFRWLVEQHEVTVFAMESDVAEGIYLDRYVQTGEGNLEAIMLERMHYWPWYTEEVRDMIQWMHEHNLDNPGSQPIRYMGVDCQTVGMQPDLLVEYIEQSLPSLLDETEAAVSPLRVSMEGAWALYEQMNLVDFEQIGLDLDQLMLTFENHSGPLIDASSDEQYQLMLYLLNNLIDSHDAMFGVYNDDLQVNADRRERCLADNVLALENIFGQGVRIAVWGHNYHVAANLYQDTHAVMGFHLREALGPDYRVIGFSFAHGQFTAMGTGDVGVITHELPPPPEPGSVNELLHAADESNFILDVGALPGSSLLDWLGQPQDKLSIGSVFGPDTQIYIPERVSELYDVIIHTDESTATVPLPVP